MKTRRTLTFCFRLNNSNKGAVRHALFHHVLWEYLQQLNTLESEEEKEKSRHDLFEKYARRTLLVNDYQYLSGVRNYSPK